MKRKKKTPMAPKSLKRDRRIVFQLNEVEADALAAYCKQYHVKNRSNFIRKCVLTSISNRFNDEYPTLF